MSAHMCSFKAETASMTFHSPCRLSRVLKASALVCRKKFISVYDLWKSDVQPTWPRVLSVSKAIWVLGAAAGSERSKRRFSEAARRAKEKQLIDPCSKQFQVLSANNISISEHESIHAYFSLSSSLDAVMLWPKTYSLQIHKCRHECLASALKHI